MGQTLRRALWTAGVVLLAWQATGGVCAAELVFLSSGRTLSVRSHRLDGPSIVLTLRTGGEITCESALVERIAPDEVPYPAPETTVPALGTEALLPVPYAEVIDRAAAREGIDPRLVRAVIQVESAYQPRARSRKGAMGLMQLMPDTAQRYAVENPYDPGANIEAGTKHLKTLLARFDLSLALAAYNAGEAAVERFRGIPPYPETQNYVRQVLGLLGRLPAR
ncbi:MAG TPA: lytic transglycosylase domain-containing protein [Vicinamibacterales bacterium]|jgi:soluble lytic murein transglycosylase-like protein